MQSRHAARPLKAAQNAGGEAFDKDTPTTRNRITTKHL